jgi:hypothetical protein
MSGETHQAITATNSNVTTANMCTATKSLVQHEPRAAMHEPLLSPQGVSAQALSIQRADSLPRHEIQWASHAGIDSVMQ